MNATPSPDSHVESLMSTCLHCGSPVVSVKLNANSEWSDWAHALTGQVECQIGVPSPPPTDRANSPEFQTVQVKQEPPV